MNSSEAQEPHQDNQHPQEPDAISYGDMRDLINRIDRMSEDHHLQIFQIIQNDQLRYSHNQNGVFINLSNAKASTLLRVRAFVDEIEARDTVLKTSQDTLHDAGGGGLDAANGVAMPPPSSNIPVGTESVTTEIKKKAETKANQAAASLNALEKKAIGATQKISRRRNLQLNSKVLKSEPPPSGV